MPISPLRQRPAYVALAEHHAKIRDRHLRDLFAGERINVSENHPVLHVALRMPKGPTVIVDGDDVVAQVHESFDRTADFATKIRSGAWKGHPGKPIRNIINIGIGASDHRPVMAYEALRRYTERNLTFRFGPAWTRRTSRNPPGTCQQKKRSTSCSARWPDKLDAMFVARSASS